MQKGCHGVVYLHSRSVQRVYYALSHTLRVYIYYLSVVCYSSVCFLFRYPKTAKNGRTEVKAPRFFYVGFRGLNKTVRFWLLGGIVLIKWLIQNIKWQICLPAVAD